jgi:AraC-like DNA-binding protein
MINFHDFVRGLPHLRKIIVDELLFAEYHCMVEATKAGIWSDRSYIAFVTSGKKCWQTLTADHVVEAGQAIFVKKGANMAYQYFDDDFCSLLIFLPDDLICGYLARRGPSSNAREVERSAEPVLRMPVDDVMGLYFASVLSYFPLDTPPSTELMRLKFEELLHHLFDRQSYADVASYLRSLGGDRLEPLRRIMEDNFAYNLELEQFASMCAMSLSTFKRSFADVFHEPPGRWLLRKRLAHGSHLLKTSDRDVNQVALDSGFENTSHFIRVFKERYGRTPAQFRRELV